ncbi:hypothetical protein [Alistipes sp. ZOR0009]|uniref:hypothetical protein n=1 Tax=Alistipes sp. ZOR0009 TaxID=1339253 RepID=UPI0006466B00|nr:hypothetical protein [Alistipes sp. ZOR0009]
MSTFLGLANVTTKEDNNVSFKSVNFSLHAERFSSLEDKGGKIPVFIVKNDETNKHEVHSSIPEGKKQGLDSSLYLDKEKTLQIPSNEQGYISSIYVSSKKDVKQGMPNLSVYSLKDNEKNYLGNGFSNSSKFENGVNLKQFTDQDGATSKLFNVRIKGSDIEKLDADSYGNVRVLINRTENGHRLLLTEKPSKETDAVLVLDKNETLSISKNNDGQIRLIVADKNPQNIGRDKSDLVIYENKFRAGDEKLSKEDKSEKFKEKNYVGAGYTNNPSLLKLKEDDLSKDGLKAAITKNETIRTFAIINAKPDLVEKKHGDLVKKMINENPSFSKGIETAVTTALKKNEAGLGQKEASATPEIKEPKMKQPKIK